MFFIGISLSELVYSSQKVIIPHSIQMAVRQFILQNTILYNRSKSLLLINQKLIYTNEEENRKESIYAIDYMKYNGYEKLYNMKNVERIYSIKRSSYLNTTLI